MVLIIITVISGLVVVGLFLKLKRMLKKGSFHDWVVLGLILCMIVFLLFTGATVMRILKSFYSIWIAWPAGLGVVVALTIVLFRLFIRELKKLKELEKDY